MAAHAVKTSGRVARHWRAMALGLCVSALLTACGGDGGGAPEPAPAPPPAPAPQPDPNPLGLDLPQPGTLRGDLGLAAGSLAPAQQSLCGGVDGVGEGARLGVVVAMSVAPDGRLFFAERPATGMDCPESPRTRRLRVLEGGGRVSTLRTWELPLGEAMEVNALAVDAQGEVFVAQGYPLGHAVFATPGYPMYRDGEAPGIWRVAPDGAASLVAGQQRAYRGGSAADGVGGEAVFVQLAAMVLGRDGLLYVSDWGALRRVDAQGVVRTLAQKGGVFGGPDGRVLAWQPADAPAGGQLTDLLTGAAWALPTPLHLPVRTMDTQGGVYGLPDLRGTRIVRLLADGQTEPAIGSPRGGGPTELGALPARLGPVQAIAGAHGHALYIAVEGAIVKARFVP